ncbi:MAG: hypothetical protein Q9186_007076 [Xanthomendoza sp. 1 TL-2023]
MAQNDTEWRQHVEAWLAGPASTPPPGVTSNLLGGPSLYKYNLGLVAFGTVLAVADQHGSGKHIWDISGRDLMMYNKLTNAIILTYTLVIILTKVSILILYLRLFTPTRSIRNIIHITLWANVLFYISAFFVAIFICNPRDAFWNPYIRVENVKCLDSAAAKIVSAVFNVVSDCTILVLPISTVWMLQMQRKKKFWTIAIFASGLL